MHVHAEIDGVAAKLQTDGAKMMRRVMRGQTLNWVPAELQYENFERFGQQGYGEAGIIWNVVMRDAENIVVVAAYDEPGQDRQGVEEGLDKWMEALVWVVQLGGDASLAEFGR